MDELSEIEDDGGEKPVARLIGKKACVAGTGSARETPMEDVEHFGADFV